ncbi:hypothetical protein [Kitasatospora sp. NPDC097643]|uniref:hypothetical protein n=1 Tax=Kitasatospora sp. NPDC097643 TaxID=3157230 RepID=UPI00331884B5
MARLYVRSGLDPDLPTAVLVVDPDGTPGERAVVRLGAYCHEGSGAFYLLQTDGWAEHTRAGDRLTVAVAVYPVGLRALRVDPADFPARSAVDPRAALVLHVEAAVDPSLPAGLAEGTVVLVAADDTPLDALLGPGAEPPMLLAPPPETLDEDEDTDGPVRD